VHHAFLRPFSPSPCVRPRSSLARDFNDSAITDPRVESMRILGRFGDLVRFRSLFAAPQFRPLLLLRPPKRADAGRLTFMLVLSFLPSTFSSLCFAYSTDRAKPLWQLEPSMVPLNYARRAACTSESGFREFETKH